jgi:coenzyme F420-reducing hydrogenase gamma subunit
MMRIGFVQLNSCGGCLLSLLANPVFPDVLKSADICHFPLVSELNALEDADVVVVEGCVTSENEEKLIRQLYTAGAKIIPLGTCATLGGIMSQAEGMQSNPVGKYVDIDTHLPGCPPPQSLIGSLLLSLVQGTEFSLPRKSVCAECVYTNDQDFSNEIRYINPRGTPRSCFIREGVICLGPVTMGGCGAKCVRVGSPCDGCFGSLERSMPAALANLFSVLTISPDLQGQAALAGRYQKPTLREEK